MRHKRILADLNLAPVAGQPLRVLQRWGLTRPASRFSTRDRRPHRSHLYKERKGGPATERSKEMRPVIWAAVISAILGGVVTVLGERVVKWLFP